MTTDRIYINQLVPGNAIDQIFVVRDKELRTTKNGGLFINLKLGDKSGDISAKMWQANESLFNSIPTEGFLQIKGRVEEYRGFHQLVIEAFRPWSKEHVNIEEFVATSPFDIEQMWQKMHKLLCTVKNKYLSLIIKKFCEDTKFITAYKNSPAAVSMHQPYLGGLLEHSLNMMLACEKLLPIYPHLNRDLLITAAFLHDAGKSIELTAGLNIHYTEPGILLGHITIMCNKIQEKVLLIEQELGDKIPQSIVTVLQHIILSHHGQFEYGSPKLPAIPEAFFLHYIDNLDAKMYMTKHAIDEDMDPQSHFTNYIRPLESRIYKFSQNLPGDPPKKLP